MAEEHVEKYSDLPTATREFVEGLRPSEVRALEVVARMAPDELALLRKILRAGNASAIVGRGLIWLFGGLSAIAAAAWVVVQLFGWFKGAK